MQYDETDSEFIKRLASHISTYVAADSTAEYGRAYFGLPDADYEAVLDEKEYTLMRKD